MFNQYAGLLSQDEQDAARNNLILNFGLGLLANAENGSSFGQAAGRAGMGAMQQQNQFSQQQIQNKLTKQKLDEAQRQQQLPDLIGSAEQGTGILGGKVAPQQLYQNMLTMGPEYAKLGMTGLGVGSESPASVREYEYYKKLPKTSQDQFLGLKRQGYEVKDIGGVPTLVARMPGSQSVPLSTLQNEMQGKAGIAGATKAATTRAEAQAEAEVGLGSNLEEIEKMRTSVKDLVGSPGFDTIYGVSGKIDPRNYVPGTEASNSQAKREQLDAMSFGISIQKMKGLGALSEAEGKKVTAAYTRANNPKISSEEARKAWDEVLGHLDTAERRARSKAGQNVQSPTNSAPTKTIKWGDL